ncbi:MAG: ABC transporter permease [bacterium]|nr:ABC transporter permease [bacterium]
MKTFFQYIYSELKRMLLSLPGICIGSLVILLCISGVLFACYAGSKNQEEKQMISIGMVADENEPFLDWIVDTISGLEKTKDTLNIKRLSEKEADKQLKKGEISVIFIIPHNYIYSIIDGNNAHVTIRFAKGQTTVVSFLLEQLTHAASSFILNSESGIYSMQEYYKIHHLANTDKDELTLNLQYIKEIAKLNRGMKTEEVETNVSSHYSTAALYFVSAIILFLLLWGLTCSKMLTSQTKSFQNQLRLRGVSFSKQLFARGIAFFAVNLIFFLCLVLVAGIVMQKDTFTIKNTLLANSSGLWQFALLLLPVLLLTTSFIQLVYEITEDAMGGVLFLFFSVMIMALCSGCFYPFSYLPEIIQKIGKCMPVYQLCQYSLSALYRSFDTSALLLILSYTVCCYAVMLLLRHIRRTHTS